VVSDTKKEDDKKTVLRTALLVEGVPGTPRPGQAPGGLGAGPPLGGTGGAGGGYAPPWGAWKAPQRAF